MVTMLKPGICHVTFKKPEYITGEQDECAQGVISPVYENDVNHMLRSSLSPGSEHS